MVELLNKRESSPRQDTADYPSCKQKTGSEYNRIHAANSSHPRQKMNHGETRFTPFIHDLPRVPRGFFSRAAPFVRSLPPFSLPKGDNHFIDVRPKGRVIKGNLDLILGPFQAHAASALDLV
jgi:hypothetical protein